MMPLRVFVLGLGGVLFLAGCGSDKPTTIVDSSDIEAIREYEANQKKMEAMSVEEDE